MKKILFFFVLMVWFTDTDAQKIRSTANLQDREYFIQKAKELLADELFPKNLTIESLESIDSMFQFHFSKTIDSFHVLLETLKNEGVVLSVILWEKLLVDFPQFKVLSISGISVEGKKVEVCYRYNRTNKTMDIYNDFNKTWTTLLVKYHASL